MCPPTQTLHKNFGQSCPQIFSHCPRCHYLFVPSLWRYERVVGGTTAHWCCQHSSRPKTDWRPGTVPGSPTLVCLVDSVRPGLVATTTRYSPGPPDTCECSNMPSLYNGSSRNSSMNKLKMKIFLSSFSTSLHSDLTKKKRGKWNIDLQAVNFLSNNQISRVWVCKQAKLFWISSNINQPKDFTLGFPSVTILTPIRHLTTCPSMLHESICEQSMCLCELSGNFTCAGESEDDLSTCCQGPGLTHTSLSPSYFLTTDWYFPVAQPCLEYRSSCCRWTVTFHRLFMHNTLHVSDIVHILLWTSDMTARRHKI